MIKVMVVDDEADVQLLFQQKFRKELKAGEIAFHFSFSGEDALQFLNEHDATDFVLILADINMPGMSGLELLKRIKQKYSAIKVFVITAYGDEKNHQLAKQYGCDDYITKPIDFDELKKKILG
jgi:CheY-like chemotaxis protein